MQHFRTAVLVLFPLLLVFWHPHSAASQSLRGSRSSVSRAYNHAISHGIYFYKTSRGLHNAGRKGTLLRLRGNSNYTTKGVSHPYVRPATLTFVERLAAQYRRACGERLVVTSAARPRSMRLINSVDRSVHPAGIAVDLRKPRDRRCRAWLRDALLSVERAGVIEATEEFRPPHFHVVVFPSPYERYVKRRGGRVHVAASSGGDGTRYRVRSGDSLWAIARRHDTTVDRLKQANGLRTTRLRPGQELVIPGAR